MAKIGRVADTSWLYAAFDRSDAHHAEARAALGDPLVTLVPSAIVNETLDLVRHRAGRDAALRAYAVMAGLPHFDLWYPVDHGLALQVWQRNDTLSLHDAWVVACCRTTGFPPATFDEAIREAARAA